TPAPTPEVGQPEGFTFKRSGRATRFVWRIDAEGRFSEVSREFAEAVGPHATKVTGVAFADIAKHFNLDPDGKIAELLARRDTWSGRTIYWPVEKTSLMVPVDLAALPTYTRSRDFDGFRGFGVVRLSDAIEDPMKLGLTLGGEEEQRAQMPSVAEEPVAEMAVPTIAEETPQSPPEESASEGKEAAHDAGPEAAEEPAQRNEEPPALKIAETPNRRESDKVIQLHQRRPLMQGGLSLSEQAAFREIARQLEPFGKRAEPPADQPEAMEQSEEVVDISPQPNAADEVLSDTVETPADDNTAVERPPAEAPSEGDETAQSELDMPALSAETEKPEEVATPDLEEPKVSSEPEQDFDPLDVLSTAIPPRVKMRDGLSAEIVDQLPLAILVHAGDRLIHGNTEFLRLTGYESLTDLEHVGGLDALLQRHDLEGKTERPGTMMVVRADDTLVPVNARLQSIRWEDGTALMLALMPLDKSETSTPPSEPVPEEARPERMVEKLAKLQVEIEELRSTLETATDGVVIIGQEGEIRSMNRSASALFNYDDQETRGKPFVMLFAHESQKAVLDYLAGLSGHGVASVLNDGREVIGREASGGFVPLFMTMGRLNSSNGYCAVIRDITQWKRTEEELRSAKRAAETANAHKTDFLARVSHEIRTPLNAIIGFSDMMAGERFGPIGHSRYIEYATDIGRSGRHVLDIVNDLLDISKIEAGEMDLEFSSVGLNEAIAEAVSLVQPQANSQRVIIRTALSQAVPNVVADLRSIKQIALNILSNAIRFTPSGGQIVVSTSYEGNGSVVMRIRDTGVGMTRSELEQAMKPFRQVSTNARKRGDGTGLGLPLTKAMVDANRATFSINSAPNEGTLVEITFPSPRVLAN
ncbi:ATP-binding protein, partial [Rhizobium mayense]